MQIELNEAQAVLAYNAFLIVEKKKMDQTYSNLRYTIRSLKQEIAKQGSYEKCLKDCDEVESMFYTAEKYGYTYNEVKNYTKKCLSDSTIKDAEDNINSY